MYINIAWCIQFGGNQLLIVMFHKWTKKMWVVLFWLCLCTYPLMQVVICIRMSCGSFTFHMLTFCCLWFFCMIACFVLLVKTAFQFSLLPALCHQGNAMWMHRPSQWKTSMHALCTCFPILKGSDTSGANESHSREMKRSESKIFNSYT